MTSRLATVRLYLFKRWLRTLLIVTPLVGPQLLAQTNADPSSTNGIAPPRLELEQPHTTWQTGIGEGFRPDAQSFGISSGVVFGLTILGTEQDHDLALISLTYGHMLSGVLGEGHWYRGNLEFRLELFGGAQFSPSTEWLVGLTPHLRYDFATGTRWIPFADLGAGVTATSIGPPDLSGTFEFNLQPGVGVLWFFKQDVALSLEARYFHLSCAGIHHPNLGLNGVGAMLGVTFFF